MQPHEGADAQDKRGDVKLARPEHTAQVKARTDNIETKITQKYDFFLKTLYQQRCLSFPPVRLSFIVAHPDGFKLSID